MSSAGLPSQTSPVVVEGTRVTSVPNGNSMVSPTTHPPPHQPGQEPPPPPPSPGDNADELWALPPGWTTARHVADGRIYYVEMATGRTSWVHPMAEGGVGLDNNETGDWYSSMQGGPSGWFQGDNAPWRRRRGQKSMLDTPFNATKRPDSHQCWACLALILCFPLGLCSMYHSFQVDKAWQEGRYGDSVNHSRQASKYGTLGIVIFFVILICILISRKERWDWPDWDFNFD